MRRRRYGGFIAIMAALLLTGCQQEEPYELTESEQEIIVNYSAHVVSKFNTYQKDGLTHVVMKEEEVPETEQPVETETVGTETVDTEQTVDPVTGEAVTGETTEAAGTETTLEEIYADTGVKLAYVSHEITDNYVESDVYALKPSHGKTFLVMHFSAENATEEAITLDNTAYAHVYSVIGTLDTGKSYHAPSVLTLLSNEWCTFEGAIEANSVADMVMIFEIPAETTEISDLILKIKSSDTISEINL